MFSACLGMFQGRGSPSFQYPITLPFPTGEWNGIKWGMGLTTTNTPSLTFLLLLPGVGTMGRGNREGWGTDWNNAYPWPVMVSITGMEIMNNPLFSLPGQYRNGTESNGIMGMSEITIMF